VGTYVPPGWPEAVRPPGSEDFEPSAIAFLLDVLPTEYRQHVVLRRYPVALASMAGYYADGCVEGARRGYRTCRRELATLSTGYSPPTARRDSGSSPPPGK
jgi:hypothetical protein